MLDSYASSYMAVNVEKSPSDEEKTGGNRNGILQKDSENSLEVASNQRRILKENRSKKKCCKQTQEEVAEISWTHDAE